jgi:hypothetical protein
MEFLYKTDQVDQGEILIVTQTVKVKMSPSNG